MTDQVFELRLQEAYDEFADGAIVDVDPTTLAAIVTRRRVRPSARIAWPVFQRPGSLALVLATLLLLIGLIGAVAVGSLLLQRPRGIEGVFSAAPDMPGPRDRPVVVALADGRVVIAEGQRGSSSDPVSAEIFDPDTASYTPLTGDIPTGSGTGLLLPDGRVLAVAFDDQVDATGNVYLMDPTSLTIRLVIGGLYADNPPYGHEPSIALLTSGQVLIVSDGGEGNEPSPAFVFDPTTEILTTVGSLSIPRTHPAVTTLNDGRVLVAAGRSATGPSSVYWHNDGLADDAELYDPDSGQFTSVGTLPSVRGEARSFLMPDGRVLIAHQGDNTSRFGDVPGELVALDMFDPTTNSFSRIEPGNWPGPPTVTQLADGALLLTGMQLIDDGNGKQGKPWAATYDGLTGVLTEHEAPRAIFPQGAATSNGRAVLVGGFFDPPLTPGNPAVPWTDVFR